MCSISWARAPLSSCLTLPSSSVCISRGGEKRCTNRQMRQGASVATTTRMSRHVCHFLKFPGAWFVTCAPWFYPFGCVFIIHSLSFQHCVFVIMWWRCNFALPVFSLFTCVLLSCFEVSGPLVKAFFSYPSNNKPKAKICLAEFTRTKKVIWM